LGLVDGMGEEVSTPGRTISEEKESSYSLDDFHIIWCRCIYRGNTVSESIRGCPAIPHSLPMDASE
jgi:hypothetical protein